MASITDEYECPIPESYLCPISKMLMNDPVSVQDGHSYERNEITKWFSKNNTSPMTNLVLDNKILTDNLTLKSAINEFKQKFRKKVLNMIKLTSDHESKDVYLLLDISSSMLTEHLVEQSKNKSDNDRIFINTINIAKHSAKTIVKMLSQNDRLCIITFSQFIHLKMDLMIMNDDNKQKALLIIDNINAQGATNIWGSLEKAFDIIKKRSNKNNFSCICLLTDGKANNSPPQGEIFEMNKVFNDDMNCVLNTYAFGTQPNRLLLKNLSDITYGLFSNIPSADMVGTTFINTISSLLCMTKEDYNRRKLKKSTDNINYQLYTKLYDIVQKLSIQNYHIKQNDLEKNLKECFNIIVQFIDDIKKKDDYEHNEFYKSIVHDLNDQVLKGLSNWEWYNNWGQGYILMLANAHQYNICNNYKDQSVQYYANDKFIKIRDNGEQQFKTIKGPEMTKRSSNVPTSHCRGHYRSLGSSNNVNTQYIGDASNLLNRNGGCILQGSLVYMKNNCYKDISLIKKGDIIITGNNKEVKVICVTKQLCTSTPFVKLSKNLIITPYHPIKFRNKWIYPNNMNIKKIYVGNILEPIFMYNIYAGEGASMIVDNYIVATLGHNLKDNDVIKNDFWGKNIINYLKKMDGWGKGLILIDNKNYIRNNNGDVVGLKINN
jgi:Mg-chelatase subunit ChlD